MRPLYCENFFQFFQEKVKTFVILFCVHTMSNRRRRVNSQVPNLVCKRNGVRGTLVAPLNPLAAPPTTPSIPGVNFRTKQLKIGLPFVVGPIMVDLPSKTVQIAADGQSAARAAAFLDGLIKYSNFFL